MYISVLAGIFIYLWQKLFKLLKDKFNFLAKHIYNSRNYLGYLNHIHKFRLSDIYNSRNYLKYQK